MEVEPAQLSKFNDVGRLATQSATLRMSGVVAKL
jgi:hypothetical protein